MKHEDFIVSMKGIQKSFGGVHALTDGELTLRKGEVLGLIGENGAGYGAIHELVEKFLNAEATIIFLNTKRIFVIILLYYRLSVQK